jgi:hypothetical protein
VHSFVCYLHQESRISLVKTFFEGCGKPLPRIPIDEANHRGGRFDYMQVEDHVFFDGCKWNFIEAGRNCLWHASYCGGEIMFSKGHKDRIQLCMRCARRHGILW